MQLKGQFLTEEQKTAPENDYLAPPSLHHQQNSSETPLTRENDSGQTESKRLLR
jgi:hypothetical protein